MKERSGVLSSSHPDLYERLRQAQVSPQLKSRADVSDILYETVINAAEGKRTSPRCCISAEHIRSVQHVHNIA